MTTVFEANRGDVFFPSNLVHKRVRNSLKRRNGRGCVQYVASGFLAA